MAFFQAADRAAEGDRIGLMMPRLDSFALAASQGGAKTPSSRLKIARKHYRCGIEGTSSRYWHLVPDLEHELVHYA